MTMSKCNFTFYVIYHIFSFFFAERFKSQCSIKQGKNSNPRVRRPKGSTPEICMDLVKHELKFIKELRAKDLALISKISKNKTIGINLDAFDPEQYVI